MGTGVLIDVSMDKGLGDTTAGACLDMDHTVWVCLSLGN